MQDDSINIVSEYGHCSVLVDGERQTRPYNKNAERDGFGGSFGHRHCRIIPETSRGETFCETLTGGYIFTTGR